MPGAALCDGRGPWTLAALSDGKETLDIMVSYSPSIFVVIGLQELPCAALFAGQEPSTIDTLGDGKEPWTIAAGTSWSHRTV